MRWRSHPGTHQLSRATPRGSFRGVTEVPPPCSRFPFGTSGLPGSLLFRHRRIPINLAPLAQNDPDFGTSGVRMFDPLLARLTVGRMPTQTHVGEVWARAISMSVWIVLDPPRLLRIPVKQRTSPPRRSASKPLTTPCPQSGRNEAEPRRMGRIETA